ncbi:MAG: alpha/beta fold hydrolase [Deltaproteobacteria bacterium]|nr:alpha/beta fold hydrolase [Deltaproteobacteria bacterium]
MMSACCWLVAAGCLFFGFSIRCTCYLIRWLEISNRPGYVPAREGSAAWLPVRPSAAACRAVLLESLSSYLLLVLWLAGLLSRCRPSRRRTVAAGGAAQPRPAAAPVVVLVPGYLMNRGTMWVLRWRLRRDGYQAVIFEPGSARRPLAEHARRLGEFIAAALPAGTPVFLVGHSMGGIICRACAADYAPPSHPVHGLCTIGSPHGGTIMWSFGLGQSARDLRPGSAFLHRLENRPRTCYPVVAAAIFSDFDELVIPNENARFPGVDALPVSMVGHFMLVLDAGVYRRLRPLLARAAADFGAAGRPPQQRT